MNTSGVTMYKSKISENTTNRGIKGPLSKCQILSTRRNNLIFFQYFKNKSDMDYRYINFPSDPINVQRRRSGPRI